MKKNIVTLILALCLLAGAVGAFAVAGGEDDPLISLSYVKTWANDLVSSAADRAKKDLSDFGGTAIASSKTYPVSYTAPYLMIGGSSMSLTEGCSVTLLSGSAKISVTAGTLVNATTGRTVSGGDMTPEQLYVVCENSAATISVPDTCTLLAGGPVTTLGNVTFFDVGSHEWFYSYVMRGVGLGLIHGVTETSFAPDKTLTVAETITLAAQLHRLNAVGNTEIPSTAAIWYDNYRNYCLQQGIIDEAYAGYTDAQMNTPATRSEFVHIFYHAMPADTYTALNDIPDDAIPDLKLSDPYGDEIYAFYRAGILSGYTGSPDNAEHAFGPGTNIRRNEMAVILVHLVDEATRVTFTID